MGNGIFNAGIPDAPSDGTVYGRQNKTWAATGTPTALFDKARVYLNTAASTTTVGWQKIPFDTVEFDNNGLWDAGNTRFKPKKAGYYLISGRVRVFNSTELALQINLNNSAKSLGIGTDLTGRATAGSDIYLFNGTTDFVELYAYITSVQAYTTGAFDTHMSILGPF